MAISGSTHFRQYQFHPVSFQGASGNQAPKQPVGLKTDSPMPASGLTASALKAHYLPCRFSGTSSSVLEPARSKQVQIVPLETLVFDLENYTQVGQTTVFDKHHQPVPVTVYKLNSEEPEEGSQTEEYKLITPNNKIIGTLAIEYNEAERTFHIPLLATTDFQYRHVGVKLFQVALERMKQLGIQDCQLTASWNSHGFHVGNGLHPEAPRNFKGRDIDRKIREAIRHQGGSENLGCNIMYLSFLARLKHEFLEHHIINTDLKAPVGDGCQLVGQTTLTVNGKQQDAMVYRDIDRFGLQTFSISVKDGPEGEERIVGKILLNRFTKDAQGRLVDQIGDYPEWSPFNAYGHRKNLTKMFAEYWDIDAGEFDETEIQRKLFKIAIDASEQLGGHGRVQIEGDWDEHIPVYRYGFRAQDHHLDMSPEEIQSFIQREIQAAKAEHRSPNTKQLGSLDLATGEDDFNRPLKILGHKSWNQLISDSPILQQP